MSMPGRSPTPTTRIRSRARATRPADPRPYTRRMERSRDTRTIVLVVAGLIVAAAGVATIGVHPHWSPDGQAANDAMLAGLSLATGAVCFTRYRSTGDTHPLFVCAGLLAVAVQTVLFDRHTFLSILNSPWEGLSFPALGWFAAWLVAAAAFVLARPWWDRRGRKPLRAPLVLSATFGLMLVIDLVLIAYRHSLPRARNVRAARRCRVLPHLAAALDLRRSHHRPPADRGVARVEGRRRRSVTPSVARRRVGDRGRRAVRPAGAADPLPSPGAARCRAGSRSPSRWRSWHSLHRNAPKPPALVAPPTARRR